MRWIAIPMLALLLGSGLWSVPASAKAENVAKVSKAGKPTKAVKATKTTKAKTSKSAKASKTSKTSKSSKLKANKAKASKTKSGKQSAKPVEVALQQPAEEVITARDASSERIYDGMLPTEAEKIVMPAVKDERGRAECVQLLKSLMDAPRTLFWKEGRKLKASWDSIRPGTAIATFKKGRYPQKGNANGNKHAAIFLRASEAGIYVFDQFAGQIDVEERFIPWHHPRDKRASNNAAAYSTVRW